MNAKKVDLEAVRKHSDNLKRIAREHPGVRAPSDDDLRRELEADDDEADDRQMDLFERGDG